MELEPRKGHARCFVSPGSSSSCHRPAEEPGLCSPALHHARVAQVKHGSRCGRRLPLFQMSWLGLSSVSVLMAPVVRTVRSLTFLAHLLGFALLSLLTSN